MTVINQLLLGIGVMLITVNNSLASDGNREQNICSINQHCVIPTDQLSTEKTDPYLWHSQTPVELRQKNLRGDQRPHLEAINRFPTVLDCLMPSERKADSPDLKLFDWTNMPDLASVEVCVFRVAASIRSVEGMKTWLESQGFRIEVEQPFNRNTIERWGYDRLPGVGITSGRSVEKEGVFWGRGWYHRNVRHYFSRYLSLSVVFSSMNEPLSVGTYLSHEFSL